MDRKHDDLRPKEEDAEEVAGGVAGLAAGAAGAAAGAAVLGPIGGVIGALAGGIGGWWAGHQLGEAALDEEEDESYRRYHEGSMSERGRSYDEVRHAYHLGHLAGRNPEYRDREFDGVEADLRRAWDEAHGPREPWDEVRPYVGAAYERSRVDEERR